MSFKKIFLLSSSAIALANFHPLTSLIGEQAIVEVSAQTSQGEDEAFFVTLKQELLEQEPIDEAQLSQVSEEDLRDYYEQAVQEDAESVTSAVYFKIAQNYTDLQLITDQTQYEQYKTALKTVLDESGFTADQLKNVQPSELITKFLQASAEYPDDPAQQVASFVETLDLRQNLMINSSDIYQQLRQGILQYTSVTEEELNQISDEEMDDLLGSSIHIVSRVVNEGDPESYKSYLQMFVIEYPDRFTPETIHEVADVIRQEAGQHTVFPMEVATQIPDEDFLAWKREIAENGGNNVTYFAEQAVANYPELFEEALQESKAVVLEHTGWTDEQISQVIQRDPARILWLVKSSENYDTFSNMEYVLSELFPDIAVQETSEETETGSVEVSVQSGVEASTTLEEATTVSGNQTTTQVQGVSVETSTATESAQSNLPQTGERSIWQTLVIAVGLTVVGGLILKKQTPNQNNEN